jgi:predicted TIM-barrel fold metal-dependent hydrolase
MAGCSTTLTYGQESEPPIDLNNPRTWGEIWDLHAHLAGMPGKTPEVRMERLIEYADRMFIHRLCVYMGMNFVYDPSPEQLRQQNDEVLAALRASRGRAFGFVYLNPKHVQASLDELERCVADGPMVGVKLWVASLADNHDLDPIVKRAAELKALVFQHTWIKANGNLDGESTPKQLAVLSERHPNAILVAGHTGGDWELGVRTLRARSNVWVDLGGSDPMAGFAEMAVRELGEERVLFGSDVPGRSFATQLAKVLGASVSDSAKRLMLGGNLKRLLAPILSDKGMT